MSRDEAIDNLVREARELRARLASTAALLDIFTEQLQANVEQLKEISTEMIQPTQRTDSDRVGQ